MQPGLFDYRFPYCIHLYTWSTQEVTIAYHMCRFFKAFPLPIFFSIISASSHKGRWFPFSLHIWSAIPDFSISPRTTALRCSSILSGQHVSPLYILPQLHGMEYTQFLVMWYSVDGLTRSRCLRRVDSLLNVVLMSYGLHIFWISSAKPLT